MKVQEVELDQKESVQSSEKDNRERAAVGKSEWRKREKKKRGRGWEKREKEKRGRGWEGGDEESARERMTIYDAHKKFDARICVFTAQGFGREEHNCKLHPHTVNAQ